MKCKISIWVRNEIHHHLSEMTWLRMRAQEHTHTHTRSSDWMLRAGVLVWDVVFIQMSERFFLFVFAYRSERYRRPSHIHIYSIPSLLAHFSYHLLLFLWIFFCRGLFALQLCTFGVNYEYELRALTATHVNYFIFCRCGAVMSSYEVRRRRHDAHATHTQHYTEFTFI